VDTDTRYLDPEVVLLPESEVAHVTCCVRPEKALCGETVTGEFLSEEEADCRSCGILNLRRFCPYDGSQCLD
jgi:hypothetical protein